MRRWGAWGALAALVVAACGGSGNQGNGIGNGGNGNGSGNGAGVDGGTPPADVDGGTDGGELDAGTPDAGTADAGTPAVPKLTLHAGPALEPPAEIVGPAQGLSHEVDDASLDAAGNLWAVSSSNLFLKRAGFGAVESFGTGDGLKGDPILGVSGGVAGTAWVGYRGQGDANEDPEWMRHTGGVGKVVLNGADIDVKNLELASPPGTYSQYPEGRYKLRTCYRAYAVKSGARAGDAWFGCNHGNGLVQGPNDHILEHHHPDYCEWHPDTQTCTMHTGDVPALAFTKDGDVWFGGTYGVGLLDYAEASGRANFWGAEPVRNLPLWDKPIDPNQYGSEDVNGLAIAQDGSLWASSAKSGLAHRLNDGTIELYQQADGLPTNDLVDLAIDGQNRLWLATAENGVYRLDLATGELRQAAGLPSTIASRVVDEEVATGRFVVVTVRGGVALYPDKP